MPPLNKTVFKVTFGKDGSAEQIRYFTTMQYTDAALKFAECVCDFNTDANVHAAYVTLSRLPDTIYPDGLSLAGWTKMDPLYAKSDGELSLDKVL